MGDRIEKVLVIWADAQGQRHQVGDLWREGEEFAFAYRQDGLERAVPLGFLLLAEFPTARGPDAPFRSPTLFPTFKQRIPPRARADYEDMLRSWGVDNEDPFEILVKSGGILHTGTLEFAEARPEDDDLSRPLFFRLAGRRFVNDAVEPSPGQPLLLERILPSSHGAQAIIFLSVDGQRVGWVPAHYIRLIERPLEDGVLLRATVERQLLLPEARGRCVVRVERAAEPGPPSRRSRIPFTGTTTSTWLLERRECHPFTIGEYLEMEAESRQISRTSVRVNVSGFVVKCSQTSASKEDWRGRQGARGWTPARYPAVDLPERPAPGHLTHWLTQSPSMPQGTV